jgi:hypothetical protein
MTILVSYWFLSNLTSLQQHCSWWGMKLFSDKTSFDILAEHQVTWEPCRGKVNVNGKRSMEIPPDQLLVSIQGFSHVLGWWSGKRVKLKFDRRAGQRILLFWIISILLWNALLLRLIINHHVLSISFLTPCSSTHTNKQISSLYIFICIFSIQLRTETVFIN